MNPKRKFQEGDRVRVAEHASPSHYRGRVGTVLCYTGRVGLAYVSFMDSGVNDMHFFPYELEHEFPPPPPPPPVQETVSEPAPLYVEAILHGMLALGALLGNGDCRKEFEAAVKKRCGNSSPDAESSKE